MSEQPRRMPALDDWPATIGVLATDLELLGRNDAREEPQAVTDSHTRKQSPSGITSGGSPLRESSSDSASCPQASSQVSSQASDEFSSKVPSAFSTEVSIFPSQPSLPSTPSIVISSHHHSSSSTSTLRPPKTYLDLAPGYYSGAFEFLPQVPFPPGFQPQFNRDPFEAMSQVDHNPSGFGDHFNSGKHHLAPLCHDQSINCIITIVTV